MAKGRSALIITDVINTFYFPEAKQLLKAALPAARNIKKLKSAFKKKKLPVIYVNDNFDDWNADWNKVFAKCSSKNSIGCEIAEILKPDEDDLFILKPKHSGFYLTALEVLLEDIKVNKLYIVGVAGNICVLFTAHDAHMRGFEVVVPKDCVASNSKKENDMALYQLSKTLKILTPSSATLLKKSSL